LIANPLVNYLPDDASPAPAPSSGAPSTRSQTVTEGTSLLANSGFETPVLPAGTAYQTVSAGKPPGLGAWTVQKGSVDVVAAPGAQAATGGQFIDLNGNDTSNGTGIITQDVEVRTGHRYALSFQLAGNPNGDPPDKTLDASLGSHKQSFTFNTKGHTNDDLGWTTHTMTYAACGGQRTVTVTFASTTTGSRGPNLDNVVLADMGETSCSGGFPWWWILLAGVLVAGAAIAVVLYARRQRAARPPSGQTDDTGAVPETPPA
jgi:choice-of-anchor C domain-containing protein